MADTSSDEAQVLSPLTDEEQRGLRKQFGDAYVKAQETFDSSVRALAAGGVGVTVTLATALEDFPSAGVIAVLLFLLSLASNFVSFATAQRDVRLRIQAVWARDRRAVFGNAWATATLILNTTAGATLIAGGGFLAYFVASTV